MAGVAPQVKASEEMLGSPSTSPLATAKTSVHDPEALTEIGRVKEAPCCSDPALRATAMTTSELASLSYPLNVTHDLIVCTSAPLLSRLEVSLHERVTEAVPVSSASSTCTRESDALSDVEIGKIEPITKAKIATGPSRMDIMVAERLNLKLSFQKTSRQGRSTQRWIHDSATNETIRLVTGCVPILRDGRILFVSSSRKAEWILPKGGWELDEEIEESALRETYEEAGVIGNLGPVLTENQYETRKAKKRRVEMEELERQKKLKSGSNHGAELSESEDPAGAHQVIVVKTEAQELEKSDHAKISDEVLSRIRGQSIQEGIKQPEDNVSTASSTYNQVRIRFFPMYVHRVCDSWPESGRCRKAVHIDEAIRIMENRPEFKKALQEVKERGLHLVKDPTSPTKLTLSRTVT